MSDLTEFLLARIAEDEMVAKGSFRDSVDDDGMCHMEWTDAATAVMWGDVAAISGLEPDYLSNHIARHDPARVLTECEAKRRIVELHRSWDENDWQSPPYFSAPMDAVLDALALPYADHPDYREEWKP